MTQNINVRFLRGYLKPCLGIYASSSAIFASTASASPPLAHWDPPLFRTRRCPGGVASVGWTTPPAFRDGDERARSAGQAWD